MGVIQDQDRKVQAAVASIDNKRCLPRTYFRELDCITRLSAPVKDAEWASELGSGRFGLVYLETPVADGFVTRHVSLDIRNSPFPDWWKVGCERKWQGSQPEVILESHFSFSRIAQLDARVAVFFFSIARLWHLLDQRVCACRRCWRRRWLYTKPALSYKFGIRTQENYAHHSGARKGDIMDVASKG
jgi:hypothetical protein